jgi:hypothetical protein
MANKKVSYDDILFDLEKFIRNPDGSKNAELEVSFGIHTMSEIGNSQLINELDFAFLAIPLSRLWNQCYP